MSTSPHLLLDLARRLPVEFAGATLDFATVEHVVAMKLEAVAADPDRRGQDLADVRKLSHGDERGRIESVIHLFRSGGPASTDPSRTPLDLEEIRALIEDRDDPSQASTPAERLLAIGWLAREPGSRGG